MWSNATPVPTEDATWITNSSELAEALSKKMTPEQLAYCVPLIGKEVRNSARYPEKLSALQSNSQGPQGRSS